MAVNDIVSPLQSISYTNKDFQSIYVELLDLVKQLTYRWDPSISNESDPGVILLKLNAIIADKCNYNIDKNVLECFPLSVTQQSNARQLYEQLGYYMNWYRSGVCNVSIKYLGTSSDSLYSIPAFTMITDTDNKVVYSILGPNKINASGKYNVGKFEIPANGKIAQVRAIQGVSFTYSINGNSTITADDLDENNRLYFPSLNVAENGIFIKNVDSSEDYSSWERKDNLLVESLGNKYFKFGLTKDQSSCYIEFPEDASYIFESGINIVYILSNGLDGNISSNTLTRFVSDINIETDNVEKTNILLNSETIYLTNTTPSVDGKDPETINSAYNSYRKTIGTFDTLITLRDYINAIYNSGLVSNVIVSDRTNDIQDTYNIIVEDNGVYKEKMIYDEENITAFSIKLYLLEYNVNPQLTGNFSKTFNVISNTKAVEAYIWDNKAVNHDIATFKSSSFDWSNFLLIKNKYPISCTIVPQYNLSSNDKTSLISNIVTALRENLNSRQLNFGESISQDAVRNIIIQSDQRIKNVSLDNINYTTWAVTYNNGTFTETQINNLLNYSPIQIIGNQYISWGTGGTEKFIEETKYRYGTWRFNYNSDNEKWSITLDGSSDAPIIVDDEDLGNDYGLINNDSHINFSVYIPISALIRSEIFAKSVLAGNSYIYVPNNVYYLSYDKKEISPVVSYVYDNNSTGIEITSITINANTYVTNSIETVTFVGVVDDSSLVWHIGTKDGVEVELDQFYGINLSVDIPEDIVDGSEIYLYTSLNDSILHQVDALETNVNIHFDNNNSEYTLRDNESLNILIPNIKTLTTYADGVKFEYYSSTSIEANSTRELSGNDYIVFYWYENSSVNYRYEIYASNTNINMIKPSFNLLSSSDSYDKILNIIEDTKKYSGTVMDDDWNNHIESLPSKNKLSTNKTISTCVENSVKIDTTYLCYWVTDNYNSDNNEYVLFNAGEQDSKILGMNECFIYATENFSEYIVLGAGTQIKRSSNLHNITMSVPIIELADINTYGASMITDKNAWYFWGEELSSPNTYLQTIEMRLVTIPEKNTVIVESKEGSSWFLDLNHENYVAEIDGASATIGEFIIKYKKAGSSSSEYSSIDIPELSSENKNLLYAQSLLNINLSPSKDYSLLENQSILYHIKGYPSTVLFSIDGQSNASVNIESSFDVNFDGENRVSTLLLNNNFTLDYLDLFLYSISQAPSIDVSSDNDYLDAVFNNDGSLRLTIKKPIDDSSNKEIIINNILLLSGNYVFYVNLPDNANVELEIDGTILQSELLNVEESSTIRHFIHKQDSNKDVSLTVSVVNTSGTSISEGSILNIRNPYKYSDPENLTSFELAFIKGKIKQLNVGENHYACTYQIPLNKLILDPLSAKSFFNKNHFCNKYTIPQMSEEGIYVSQEG